MLPLALLGLVAAALAHTTAASPLVEPRQEAACAVTVASCDGQPMVLDLTECACACLQNSCDLVSESFLFCPMILPVAHLLNTTFCDF